METKKVAKQKHAGGRPSRGLNVRKPIYMTQEHSAQLAKAARRYGTEANVVRLALEAFFLAEGVSISNTSREQQTTDAELAAA